MVDDIGLLESIRANTDAEIRVDANEGWSFDDAKLILPELQKLKVTMIEQPLHRKEHDAMKELKALSTNTTLCRRKLPNRRRRR